MSVYAIVFVKQKRMEFPSAVRARDDDGLAGRSGVSVSYTHLRFYRFKEIPAASEKVRLQITQPIFDILITMCYDLYIKLFMPAGLLF